MNESDIIGYMVDYAMGLPSKAMAGDVFAVSILLILIYVLIIVINKLTDILILFLKRVILLIIVSLAFYQFLQLFSERLRLEGPTTDTLIFGGIGFVVGCIALIIAVHGAFRTIKKVRPRKIVAEDRGELSKEKVEKPKAEKIDTKKPAEKKIISIKALKGDKRLGTVIAYLIVAEFGVISSKTVAAPNITVGVWFFIAFIIAALFFIKQSYVDYRKGIRHLMVAFLVGGILSVILGHFWGGHPLNELLSGAYFVSDSLVAFVTGIAVSLFMGSRG